MATQNVGDPNDPLNSGISTQELNQINYQDYVATGGNPSTAVVGPNGNIVAGTPPNDPYSDPNYLAALGGYGASSRYAPYDEGGGHTKWDEFVQQMNLENQKLSQEKLLQEEQLAQQKQIEEDRIAEQKYASQQQAVGDFDKDLFAAKGPADPYGYLFQSRGLASPQGYAPTAMPLSDAVTQAYQSQGVNLADAQKQLVGSSGPSFISGYLGGMPASQQQGPMGFQNTPSFKDVAPGSQPQPQGPPGPPVRMAMGGMVPGPTSIGVDTVPAMLSPGEGVLTPDAVKSLGGADAVNNINQQSVQHFATGGIVNGFGLQAPQTQITPDSNNQIAGQTVGANTVENAPTPGYTMTAPGVAMPGGGGSSPSGFSPGALGYVTGPRTINSGGLLGAGGQDPTGGSSGLLSHGIPPIGGNIGNWVGEVEKLFSGAGTNSGLSRGGGVQNWMPFFGGNSYPPTGGTFNPAAPELTGGLLTAPPPAGQTPINLNMLDPYTRSLVDQYGRPLSPSMQAWSEMPQSGKDAYTNYVEKVAGGNMQDLLDMQQQMTPQGDAAALRNTMSFK